MNWYQNKSALQRNILKRSVLYLLEHLELLPLHVLKWNTTNSCASSCINSSDIVESKYHTEHSSPTCKHICLKKKLILWLFQISILWAVWYSCVFKNSCTWFCSYEIKSYLISAVRGGREIPLNGIKTEYNIDSTSWVQIK